MFYTNRAHRSMLRFIASMLGMLTDSIIQDMESAGIEPINLRRSRRGLRDVERINK